MALTDKDHAEIRRLTVLKMALDSRLENDTTPEQIIERAKKFEQYIAGEQDEKTRQS